MKYIMVIIILSSVTLAYVAPDRLNIELILDGDYTAPDRLNIELVLGDAPEGDSCSCPGLDNNWEIDMSDSCLITDDCFLGTGTLTFTGAGIATCDATINSTELGDPGAGSTLFYNDECTINIAAPLPAAEICNLTTVATNGGAGSLALSTNEVIVVDSEGNKHMAYEDSNSDAWYANDSTGNWTSKRIFEGTVDDVGIAINTSGAILVFFIDTAGTDSLDGSISFNGGVTFSVFPFDIIATETSNRPSCVSDSNGEFHCIIAPTELHYTNSSDWNTVININTDSGDDTDSADIAVDDNGNAFIVGVGSDDDSLDIWSNLDGWIRHEIDGALGVVSTGWHPSIAIRGDVISIAMTKDESTFDKIFYYNSTIADSAWTSTWSSIKAAEGNNYQLDLAVNASGEHIEILSSDSTVGGESSDVFRTVSNDSGLTWMTRVLLHLEGAHNTIADTNYPTTNRLNEIEAIYAFTNTSNGDVMLDCIKLFTS